LLAVTIRVDPLPCSLAGSASSPQYQPWGGSVTALMSMGTDNRPPVVLDLGSSFLLACLFLTAVSINALRRRITS